MERPPLHPFFFRMRDPRHFLFYSDTLQADRLFLDADETRHAVAVLRLTEGETFFATDGRGTRFECTCEAITGGLLSGMIVHRQTVPRRPCSLHLLAGMPERPAFETLVTDCAALGVEKITPVICSRSQQRWWEHGWEKISARLRAKMIAALKQSLYPWLTVLGAPQPFEMVCAGVSGPCVTADPEGAPFPSLLAGLRRWPGRVTCVVGPPGGFTPWESEALTAAGALGVNLGPTRLTTGLAAVVLCGMVLGSEGERAGAGGCSGQS
jgi:16S rRNA (uracil1498-N3)-methyltransferase